MLLFCTSVYRYLLKGENGKCSVKSLIDLLNIKMEKYTNREGKSSDYILYIYKYSYKL